MADNLPSEPESQRDSDFIELAMEMALLEPTDAGQDAFLAAESVLREAVEFRKNVDQAD